MSIDCSTAMLESKQRMNFSVLERSVCKDIQQSMQKWHLRYERQGALEDAHQCT